MHLPSARPRQDLPGEADIAIAPVVVVEVASTERAVLAPRIIEQELIEAAASVLGSQVLDDQW